ncbi:MAG: GerMN domain-containing protein, partial [Naasia sp.]
MSALRAGLAGLLALLAILTVGCASIPTRGGVQEGATVTSREQEPFAFQPAGPSDGATAGEVLRGFIAAAVRPQDRYSVARQFLTPELAQTWDPTAGVTLHDSPNLIRDDGTGTLQLSVDTVGSLDRAGVYLENADAESATLIFEVQQVDGQWRVSKAPDGVVLLRQTFERLYTQRTLYFFDPSFGYLVPDVRWFLAGTTQPTQIVQALLEGPPNPLAAPVTASAFPAGTSLTKDSVVASDGELVVDLDDSVLGLDTLILQRMRLQLTRSLVGGSVVGVELRADGTSLDIPEITDGPVQQPQIDPRAAVGDADAFGWLVSGEIESVPGIGEAVAALAPRAVSLDASTDRAADLAEGGAFIVRDGVAPLLLDSRPGLIAPALDTRGYTWTVPTSSPTAIQVADLEGGVTSITAGWSDLSAITAIGVSRDGTRLLVNGVAGPVPALRVYGIIRDADRKPVALSADWFELVPPEGSPVSATWADDVSVASLGRTASGGSSAHLQVVGGASDELSPPDAASAILGGSGEASLR